MYYYPHHLGETVTRSLNLPGPILVSEPQTVIDPAVSSLFNAIPYYTETAQKIDNSGDLSRLGELDTLYRDFRNQYRQIVDLIPTDLLPDFDNALSYIKSVVDGMYTAKAEYERRQTGPVREVRRETVVYEPPKPQIISPTPEMQALYDDSVLAVAQVRAIESAPMPDAEALIENLYVTLKNRYDALPGIDNFEILKNTVLKNLLYLQRAAVNITEISRPLPEPPPEDPLPEPPPEDPLPEPPPEDPLPEPPPEEPLTEDTLAEPPPEMPADGPPKWFIPALAAIAGLILINQ